MRLLTSLPASLLLVAAVAGPAAADTAEQPPAVQPAFAIMDNTADPSHVAADVAMSIEDEGDGMLVRTNLRGQFIAPNGFGGYASVAASSIVFEDGDDEGSTELGSLELGGLIQFRKPTSNLGLRAGLILPTATYGDDEDSGFGGFAHIIGTLITRPADFATVYPETTWLRLGISPTFHNRGLFMRADAGLDVPVIETDGVDPIGHVNLGIGFYQGKVSGTFELQNLFFLTDDDSDEVFYHTGAVSLRYQDKVSPFVALSLPLDDEFRGDIVMLTVGLSAAL